MLLFVLVVSILHGISELRPSNFDNDSVNLQFDLFKLLCGCTFIVLSLDFERIGHLYDLKL